MKELSSSMCFHTLRAWRWPNLRSKHVAPLHSLSNGERCVETNINFTVSGLKYFGIKVTCSLGKLIQKNQLDATIIY